MMLLVGVRCSGSVCVLSRVVYWCSLNMMLVKVCVWFVLWFLVSYCVGDCICIVFLV